MCRPLFKAAWEGTTDVPRGEEWRAWLAVRDACPLGRAHRYTEPQVLYHYTHEPRYIRHDMTAAIIRIAPR